MNPHSSKGRGARNFRTSNLESYCHYARVKVSTTNCASGVNYLDTNNYTPLFLAVHQGNLELTNFLCKEDSVDKKLSGRTLLHVAAVRGHEKIVCFLCKRHADIGAKDKYLNTPLHLSVQKNHINIVHLLANHMTVNLENIDGKTPLSMAIESNQLKLVGILLKKCIQIDRKDKNGKTLLHIAVDNKYRNVEIIKMLLRHGASIHLSCNKGFTSLHYAAATGNIKITEVLINKGVELSVKNTEGLSPLGLAIQQNNSETVKFLLNKGADPCFGVDLALPTLHYAAQNGMEEIVKLLLAKGNKINSLNMNNETALHLAAANGHNKVVKYLLESGAEIDCKSSKQDTSLHLSAAAGHPEIVKELLDRDANIKAVNNQELTPLMLAVKGKKVEVAGLLIAKQAATDPIFYGLHQEDNILHMVAKNGDKGILEILLAMRFKIDCKGKNNKTPLHFAATFGHKQVVEALVKGGADVNSLTTFSESPLHLAAASGRIATVKYLLHSHANANVRTNKGYTPLHYALDRKRHNDIMNHKKRPVIDYTKTRNSILFNQDLFNHHTDSEFSVTSGMFEKHLQITEILLMKKANANSVTHDGETALNFAMKIRVRDEDSSLSFLDPENTIEKKFRPEIIRCLFNYGATINKHSLELMTAIELECPPLVDILIEYDVNKFFDYKSALRIAKNKKNRRIILSVLEQIDDIDTVAKSIIDAPLSIRQLLVLNPTVKENENLKLMVSALVKMRSNSKCIVDDEEIKSMEKARLHDWYLQSELEIMKMRETKVHSKYNTTYYDFLTKSPEKLATYARRRDFMKNLRCNAVPEFPAYSEFLKKNIQKGNDRKSLIESTEESFLNLIHRQCKIILPKLIVDKIFEHLTVIDFYKLSSTIKEKSYNKPSLAFKSGKQR